MSCVWEINAADTSADFNCLYLTRSLGPTEQWHLILISYYLLVWKYIFLVPCKGHYEFIIRKKATLCWDWENYEICILTYSIVGNYQRQRYISVARSPMKKYNVFLYYDNAKHSLTKHMHANTIMILFGYIISSVAGFKQMRSHRACNL